MGGRGRGAARPPVIGRLQLLVMRHSVFTTDLTRGAAAANTARSMSAGTGREDGFYSEAGKACRHRSMKRVIQVIRIHIFKIYRLLGAFYPPSAGRI